VIQLDGDDPTGVPGQVDGEGARAGANLESQILRGDFGCVHDATRGGVVGQEVLPQAFARNDAASFQPTTQGDSGSDLEPA